MFPLLSVAMIQLSLLLLHYFTLSLHIFECVCTAMFLDIEGELNGENLKIHAKGALN